MTQVAEQKKPSSRILTLDIMRGYFLLVILIIHLQYFPSGLELLTGKGWLYASTAEGFFVISGIVLGIVRGSKLLDQPFHVPAKKLLARAGQLYLTSVALTLLFTFIGWFFIDNPGLKFGIYPQGSSLWSLLTDTLTFSYVYGWADFLRHYTLFLLVAPIAIWLLRKGYWYILMALSLAVWALFPLIPTDSFTAQPISWQLIFFGGLTIGFHWNQLQAIWTKIAPRRRSRYTKLLLVAAVVTFSMSALLVFGFLLPDSIGSLLTSAHHSVEWLFNKDRLPLTRVLLGSLWFWVIFYLVRMHEHAIMQKVGRFLVPLGTNSLYVYTISAIIIFFMHLFVLPSNGSTSPLLNLALSCGAIILVYLGVRTRFLMRIIPR